MPELTKEAFPQALIQWRQAAFADSLVSDLLPGTFVICDVLDVLKALRDCGFECEQDPDRYQLKGLILRGEGEARWLVTFRCVNRLRSMDVCRWVTDLWDAAYDLDACLVALFSLAWEVKCTQ